MQGRIKRRQGLREAAERATRTELQEGMACALCHRQMGALVEWHHPVPKSEGGTKTVPLHPICHRAIHAQISNRDLAEEYAAFDVLRAREDMQRFLRWIASKPPNFQAPTHRKRD